MKQKKFETVPLKEVLGKVVAIETNGVATKDTTKGEPYSVRCESDDAGSQPGKRFRKRAGLL